jgi:hypothetical protein
MFVLFIFAAIIFITAVFGTFDVPTWATTSCTVSTTVFSPPFFI